MDVELHKIAQQSWADGVSAAIEDIEMNNVKGRCEQIEVVLNDNTNDVTATVTINSAQEGQLFTAAGIAENATTVFRANTMGATDSDFEAFLVSGDITIDITPSGDPGSSGLTVDVYLYLVR